MTCLCACVCSMCAVSVCIVVCVLMFVCAYVVYEYVCTWVCEYVYLMHVLEGRNSDENTNKIMLCPHIICLIQLPMPH